MRIAVRDRLMDIVGWWRVESDRQDEQEQEGKTEGNWIDLAGHTSNVSFMSVKKTAAVA